MDEEGAAIAMDQRVSGVRLQEPDYQDALAPNRESGLSRRVASAAVAMTLLWATTIPVRANSPFGDGPIATGQPCVTPNHYTTTDSLIYHTGLENMTSTQVDEWYSFNCFYYVMTWILGRLPIGIKSNIQDIKNTRFGPGAFWAWGNHEIAGNAYVDNVWMTDHGYKQQFVTKSIAAGPVGIPGGNGDLLQGFKPNDIIMVPGSLPNPLAPGAPVVPQSFVHIAVVTKTDGNGHVTMTRQKINPWTCTTDLPPASFDRIYGSVGPIFEVWRLYAPTTDRPPAAPQTPRGGVPSACKTFEVHARELPQGSVGQQQQVCALNACIARDGRYPTAADNYAAACGGAPASVGPAIQGALPIPPNVACGRGVRC